MKHKRKKWLRRLLEELTQINGQNSDMSGQNSGMILKQHLAAKEFVEGMQSAAHDLRRAMTPDWLIITEGTKVDVHDISSVELQELDPKNAMWCVRMKNGTEFAIPVNEVSEYATKHPAFSV